jgi:hypothetical protein
MWAILPCASISKKNQETAEEASDSCGARPTFGRCRRSSGRGSQCVVDGSRLAGDPLE